MMDRGLSSQSISLTLSGISLSFSLIGLAIWSEAYLSHATWSASIASMELFFGLSGLVGLALLAAYPIRRAKH
jgi:hypothetical protein